MCCHAERELAEIPCTRTLPSKRLSLAIVGRYFVLPENIVSHYPVGLRFALIEARQMLVQCMCSRRMVKFVFRGIGGFFSHPKAEPVTSFFVYVSLLVMTTIASQSPSTASPTGCFTPRRIKLFVVSVSHFLTGW